MVFPRQGSSSRRTALQSRPDGSGEPSYGRMFLAEVIVLLNPNESLVGILPDRDGSPAHPGRWRLLAIGSMSLGYSVRICLGEREGGRQRGRMWVFSGTGSGQRLTWEYAMPNPLATCARHSQADFAGGALVDESGRASWKGKCLTGNSHG